MSIKIRKSWTRNRDISRRARHGKHWCMSCDMAYIGAGQKCPICKRRRTKNLKRETNS